VILPNAARTDDPLEFDEQVSTKDGEHGTMPLNIEDFHALLGNQ
jgi:hypothetical protein